MDVSEGTESAGNRIQVLVRVRPPIGAEVNADLAVACSPSQEHVQVLVPERLGEKPQLPSHSTVKAIAKKFTLDACLDGSMSQESIALVCNMADLVDGALQGFPVTVFAFGQTGSGKTYSMIGPRLGSASFDRQEILTEADGLLARAYSTVFDTISAQQEEMHVSVRASCCEIYHDQVSDLAPGSKQNALPVRHDKHRGFFVEGLTEVPCSTCIDALTFMHKALTTRHIRSTRLNEYSSRGHCIMTLQFETTPLLSAQPENVLSSARLSSVKKYGKLVLVDLAGSERLKSAGNDAEAALKETGSINRSLFALGQVLAGLSMRRTSSFSSVPPVIPYRDSTLTKLLYEGLKGNGRVLMMACCSPSKAQAEETLNTLHFASMALRVKCNPLCILDPQDKLVLNLRGTITKLKQENQQLSTALRRSRSNSGSGSQDAAHGAEADYQQRSVWDPPIVQPTQRSTLDLMPLTTYPSLIKHHSPRPTAIGHNPSLATEYSQDFGSYSGLEDDVWAAKQGMALRGMNSADFSVPYGSSPERVRIIQDDYNAHQSSRDASPKRISPPRGAQSSIGREGSSPSRRDVSPKHSRSVAKGPFVLSPNPSAFSLSTLPSTLQASGAAQQMMGVEAFPELAAMEAEFQASLARGPSKPSLISDPSSLQPPASSQGPWSPEQLLRRSGLSLGSGQRLGASQKSSKGFDRGSAAGGILNQLQMPNRLGLKFPSRNFGREKAAKPASPVLAPLPSPPVVSSPDTSPPKPAVVASNAPAAGTEAVEPVAKVALGSANVTQQAPAADQAAQPAPSAAALEPEFKKRLHSRFTEEHLMQLVPDLQAETAKAPESSDAAQSSADTDLPLSAKHAATIQTQTSVIGQHPADADMPLHGFRRHMSLRDPMVGIEQLIAVVASRQLHHKSAGPSDDDIMAVAQQAALARRRSSADRLSDMQSNTPVVSQPADADSASSALVQSDDGEAEETQTATTEPHTEAVPLADGVGLQTRASDAHTYAALAPADDEQATSAGEPPSEHAAANSDEPLMSPAAPDAAALDPSSGMADAPDVTMGSPSQRDDATVDTTIDQLGADTAQQFEHDTTEIVKSMLGELHRDTAEHYARQVSSHVDSTLASLTADTTSDIRQQTALDVDGTVDSIASDTATDYRRQTGIDIDSTVDSLTAATAVDYRQETALDVDGTVDSIALDTATDYRRQTDTDIDSTVDSLTAATAIDYRQQSAVAVDDTVDTLTAGTATGYARQTAVDIDSTVERLTADAAADHGQQTDVDIDAALSELRTDADAAFSTDASAMVDGAVTGLLTEVAEEDSRQADAAVDSALAGLGASATRHYARNSSLAVDAVIDDIGSSAAAAEEQYASQTATDILDVLAAEATAAERSDAFQTVDDAVGQLQTDAFNHDVSQAAAAAEAATDDLTAGAVASHDVDAADAVDAVMGNLQDQTAAEYSQQADADVGLALDDITTAAAGAADTADAGAVDALIQSLGRDTAAHYRRQDSALVNATVDDVALAAVDSFEHDQSAALESTIAGLTSDATQHYDTEQDLAVRDVLASLGNDTAAHYAAAEDTEVGSLLDDLQSQAAAHEAAEAGWAADAATDSLAMAAVEEDGLQQDTAVAAVVDSLGLEAAQEADQQQAAAVADVVHNLTVSTAAGYDCQQDADVAAVVDSLGAEANRAATAHATAVVNATLRSLQMDSLHAEQQQVSASVTVVVDELASDMARITDEHDSTAVEAATSALADSAIEHVTAEQSSAVDETLASLGNAADTHASQSHDSAVDAALSALSDSAVEHEKTQHELQHHRSALWQTKHSKAVPPEVLASLGKTEIAYFSPEQEALLQSTLEDLTTAALGAEAEERDAAVQQILTALSGDAEAEVQQSLKEDVDIMIDSIRAEVAASAESEVAMDVEDALQAMKGLTVAHYSRQQSLTVDRIVDSLALEAATSYGGTRKPAAAQALRKQLRKAAQQLPTLAVASGTSLAPLPDLPVPAARAEVTEQIADDKALTGITNTSLPPLPDLPSPAPPPTTAAEADVRPSIQAQDVDNTNASVSGVDMPIAQLPPQLQAEVRRIAPRINSLASIDALLWPESRRISSTSGSQASHADLDTLMLARDLLQQQAQAMSTAQPAARQLRTTASINALIWPQSDSASAHSRVNDSNNDSQASVRSVDGNSVSSQQRHTSSQSVPSAEDIDGVLWPGGISQPRQVGQSTNSTAGPALRARALQTHQRSLLDRAAAKRALAALLAAAKASQIRGWTPKSFRPVASPTPPERAVQGLPSLEDIEALVPVPESRNSDLEDTAFEPAAELGAKLAEAGAKPVPDSSGILALHELPDTAVADASDAEVSPGSTGMAVPPISDAAALPEMSDLHTLPDIQAWSQASDAGAVPDDPDMTPMPERLVEHDSTIVDSVLADMQNATAAAVEEQQMFESAEVLEEAIQAAALEADFTFPDDRSSSHGDQSLAIDDIIESLEIDAMEAEQEALLVQKAEQEAQARLKAEVQAEEDARAAVLAEQRAQAERQAEAAKQAQADALAAVAAAQALQAARRAEEEARLAEQARAEEQARAALLEQAQAAHFAREVVLRAVSLAREDETRAAQLAAEEQARLNVLAAEEQMRLAQLAAEENIKLAQLAAEEQIRLGQASAEKEARLAQLAAELEARAAQLAAQEATRAKQMAAEEEALRAAAEARATQLAAEEQARAARLAAEEEARVRRERAEEEARAAQLAAEEEERVMALVAAEEAKAAQLRAREEARVAHDVVVKAVSLAREEEARALMLAQEEAAKAAQQAAEAELKAKEERQAALRAEEEQRKAKEAKRQAAEEAAAMEAMMLGKPQHSHTDDIAAAIDQKQAASPRSAGRTRAAKALASIPEEGSGELAGRIPAFNGKAADDYPGLEPDALPETGPLFKFKAQAFPEDDNRADRIAAGAAQDLVVYNMMTDSAPTFRDTPLDPAISISPRQTLRSSMARTSSSIGGQSFQQYEDQDLRRSRSSLIQRSGSIMSQYVDPEGQVVADAPEPMALQWAARNPWFGTDSEMTYYAYEVHDQLIEQEGVDPNSAEYYEQIGFRVEQRFPERYVERSLQPTPRLSDFPPTVNNSLRQMSLPKSGRISPFDPSKPITSPKQTPPNLSPGPSPKQSPLKLSPAPSKPTPSKLSPALSPKQTPLELSPAPSAAVKPQNPVRRNTSGSSGTSASSYTDSSYTSSSYTSTSYTGNSRSDVTRTISGSSYSRTTRSGSESGSFTTATGSQSQSRSASEHGSRTVSSSNYSSRNVSARSAGQPAAAPGQGIRSRQVYSQSGSGPSYTTGSDSRTTSASSYTSGTTMTTNTDSRPASSRLPAISATQPKSKAASQTTVVQKSVTVTTAVKGPYQGRPVSSGSESGSDSSYSSSGTSASASSARSSPPASTRQSQTPTLPKLPSPQKPGQAIQQLVAGSSPTKRTTADRLVVAGMVTQPSRKSLSASGSESSSFSSRSTSSRSTARGTNLPAIAGSSNKSPPMGPKTASKGSSQSVQQQQELARSSLQQSKAAAEQEKARIKNSIQQQLRPGRMLF